MIKSLNWYLRRHPLLYKIRFRLVSKSSSIDRIENICYNTINKKADIPNFYFELNDLIFPKTNTALSDLETAKEIAIWLRNNIKGGVGLGKSSETALRKMIKGEGGVCSDFSQIFNNFCVINDLKVQEWGIKIVLNNLTLGGGHSFNKVYSKELKKWILIDVDKSIYFYDKDPNLPLSIFELLDLKRENKEISFFSFNKNNAIDAKRINEIYLNSNSFPFLITNYCNKTYDYSLDKLHFIPMPIVHGLLFLIGKSYVFEFPTNNTDLKSVSS
jgi:hypothetical protein